MAVFTRSETDLLIPLYRGLRGNTRFRDFLDRLQSTTRAQHVALFMRNGDAATGEIRFWATEGTYAAALVGTDGGRYVQLRPNRVYSITELIAHDEAARTLRAEKLTPLGIVDERIVRVQSSDDLSAWLFIARDRPCSAADSALLSRLAPHVGTAIATAVALDFEGMLGRISALALDRSAAGWFAFDREARLLAADPGAAMRWRTQVGLEPRIGERLRGIDVQAERQLAAMAAMAADADWRDRLIALRERPRIEAQLLRLPADSAGLTAPSLVAHLAFPKSRTRAAIAQFAEARALPPREAELALALADGLSIAEAAEAMGLALETARNYSKRLYAKLGIRGQTELVRLVCDTPLSLRAG